MKMHLTRTNYIAYTDETTLDLSVSGLPQTFNNTDLI